MNHILPDEILLIIFGKCNVQDTLACRLVSNIWKLLTTHDDI